MGWWEVDPPSGDLWMLDAWLFVSVKEKSGLSKVCTSYSNVEPTMSMLDVCYNKYCWLRKLIGSG